MSRILDPNRHVVLPWRIVVDSAETHPWTFTGMTAKGGKAGRPIIVETVTRCLGRHPDSYGDYSIESADGEFSFMGTCAIERKSLADLQDTLLNFTDERHARFEQEMKNFWQINIAGGCAAVITECSFAEAIMKAPEFGTKSKQQNARSIAGSILAMAMDYHVVWLPFHDRRMAEVMTFKFFERYWKHHKQLVPKENRKPCRSS